jgi:hypothetical protein
MENTKNLSMATIQAMNLEQLQSVNTKGLSAPAKQAISVRIAHLTAPAPEDKTPVETAQEQIAQDAVTAPDASKPAETPAPIVNVPKNKPYETTRTIVSFKDDTKGIRAGSMVTFLENNKPGAKTMTGQVQRLFDFWLKPERQEAKIMVTDAKGNKTRFYRFEKDIQPVVIVPEGVVAEGEGI